MTTFKVGDKVRVLDVSAIKRGEKHYFNGMETEVVSMYDGIMGRYPKLRDKYGDPGISIHSQELHAIELIKTKTTKNQRITALEEKVKYLESVIDSLTHKKWTEDDLNEIEAQTLTNNEKRKAIIEKAKKFVEDQKDKEGHVEVDTWFSCTPEWIVNENKRTVVVLLKGYESGKLRAKGIAKCAPTDVFNEHIGKAIALGRALGLDVSEFEQAVQPTEFAQGQIIRYYGSIQKITEIDGERARVDAGGFHWTHRVNEEGFEITNDTDAFY